MTSEKLIRKKTPVNIFNAEPYVHYQRQLYYAIVSFSSFENFFENFKNFRNSTMKFPRG